MGLEKLELIFDYDAFDDLAALDLALLCLDLTGREGHFISYGERLERRSLEKKVRTTHRFPTDLHLDRLELQHGGSRTWNHTFLMVIEESQRAEKCDQWVEPAMKQSGFVLAWAVDREFDFWQNAEDPIQYHGSDRSCEGLPMISNGAPYPLEQSIIDISRNPGRRILRDGYVEGIGHTMWLSPLFWQKAGIEKDEQKLRDAGWRVSQVSADVLKLDAPTGLMIESGSRDLQERLRVALYE